MPDSSRRALFLRRAFAWSVAWLVSAAFYLVLIDSSDLPELIVAAAAAALAATGFELVREQRIAGERVELRWLRRGHVALLKVPTDVVAVSLVAFRQLVRRDAACGEFRAVRFGGANEEPLETGRRALAESLGSFAPNTIIVGIDGERELILAHQLRRKGGREAIDLLDLG
jgi:hypothetical protein